MALRNTQHFSDFIIRRASIRPHKDQGDFLKVIQVGWAAYRSSSQRKFIEAIPVRLGVNRGLITASPAA